MLLVFDSDAPGFTIPGFRSFRGPKSHSWEKPWEKPFHVRIQKNITNTQKPSAYLT